MIYLLVFGIVFTGFFIINDIFFGFIAEEEWKQAGIFIIGSSISFGFSYLLEYFNAEFISEYSKYL